MASAKHGLYKLMAEGSTDTQTSRFQTESCHVLVADDDRLNQRILREKLNALGHKVTCVSNGELALEAMENEAFDLALLDMIMPKLGGEKVLIQMKKAEKLSEIPAIMIAGLDDQSSLARCIELGADDYLTKPYNPVLLKARIHACLEKKRLQEKEKLAKEALIESQLHLKTELAEAAVYVRSILPELLTDDIKTDWRFVPSTQLGGDSFGYHWIDDDHFAMYLLDVCGHGVGAALLSIAAINVLRSHMLPDTDFTDPGAVMAATNDMFQMEKHNDMYFTIWYGVYSRSKHEIRHSCGGHPPALLMKGADAASAKVVQLKAKGLVTGTMPGLPYEVLTEPLDEFNTLFLFSDGVYEITRPDGTMWEFEDFERELAKLTLEGRSEMDQLFALAMRDASGGSLEDDFSMVKIQLPGK